jgi:hypothetical protein
MMPTLGLSARYMSMSDVNQRLTYRDIRFSIVRETAPDEPSMFRWTIFPPGRSEDTPSTDVASGPKAFGRAHTAACKAIDAWLGLPQFELEAIHQTDHNRIHE